jgi:hypothetical protein
MIIQLINCQSQIFWYDILAIFEYFLTIFTLKFGDLVIIIKEVSVFE